MTYRDERRIRRGARIEQQRDRRGRGGAAAGGTLGGGVTCFGAGCAVGATALLLDRVALSSAHWSINSALLVHATTHKLPSKPTSTRTKLAADV